MEDENGLSQKTYCIAGTNWNNAANAGTFYVNVNNGVTNSNANIGTRQLGKQKLPLNIPYLSVEISINSVRQTDRKQTQQTSWKTKQPFKK